MRAFVTFLVVSFLWALFMIASSLTILFASRDYAEGSFEKKIGTGVGLTISLITFLLTVKPWFRNTCRFVTTLSGTISAIVATMLYCRDPPSFIAAAVLYIAIGYGLIIRHMLGEYLELVSQHLTNKEKHARKQCTKEKCLDKDNDFKL